MASSLAKRRSLASAIATLAVVSLSLPAFAATEPPPGNETEGYAVGNETPDPEQQGGDNSTEGDRAPSSEDVWIGRSYFRAMTGDELDPAAESSLGNLVADMVFKAVKEIEDYKDVDFVLFNTAELRADLIHSDIAAGRTRVTESDIVALFATPYRPLMYVEMDGLQLYHILQEQLKGIGGTAPLRISTSEHLTYINDLPWLWWPRVKQVQLNGRPFPLMEKFQVIVSQSFIEQPETYTIPKFQEVTILPHNHPYGLAHAVRDGIALMADRTVDYIPTQRSFSFEQGKAFATDVVVTEGEVYSGPVASLAYKENDIPIGHPVLEVVFNGEPLGRYHIDTENRDNSDATGVAEVRYVMPLDENNTGRFEFKIDGVSLYAWNKVVGPSPSYHTYTDVGPTNHFANEISWLTLAKISTGWPNGDGTYRYQRYSPVLRDQMAAFLYRLAVIADPDKVARFATPEESPFSDVPTSHVFFREIAWMQHAGISTGWPDGTFRPYQPVLRDQMAAFLYRSAQRILPQFAEWETPEELAFTDVPSTQPFFREIQWMNNFGISTGWDVASGKEYRPYQRVLRDQMAAFLQRLYNTTIAFSGDIPQTF